MKGIHWVCTLNNPEYKLETIWNPTKMKYMTGQLEVGEEGTRHL